MVCRDKSTDVRRTTLFGPFLLIFVDFHHSRLTSIFSQSNLLKMSQISKCYSSSSFCPIKILSSRIDSKFQRKLANKTYCSDFQFLQLKKGVAFCVNHHSKFMVIDYANSFIYDVYGIYNINVLYSIYCIIL